MILASFTLIHVLISLVAILAGWIVLFGLITAKPLNGWNTLFLTTTVLTSVTGFLFPVKHFMPSDALGIISLVALSIAIYALYGRNLKGGWRKTYVITSVMALYLNMFVLVVQSFMKVPALKLLAPTQTEGPFKIAQLSLLVIFLVLGTIAAVRFRGTKATGTNVLS